MSQMPPPAQEPTAPVTGRPGELLDRFLARLIDGLILGVAYGILSAIFTPIFIAGVRSWGELILFYAVVSIIWVAISIGYFAYMESSRGQSLGKMALKLQVFGPSGGHPTMEEAVKRNSFYAISLVQIIPFIGWAVSALAWARGGDPDRRRDQQRHGAAAGLARQVRGRDLRPEGRLSLSRPGRSPARPHRPRRSRARSTTGGSRRPTVAPSCPPTTEPTAISPATTASRRRRRATKTSAGDAVDERRRARSWPR